MGFPALGVAARLGGFCPRVTKPDRLARGHVWTNRSQWFHLVWSVGILPVPSVRSLPNAFVSRTLLLQYGP